MINNMLESPLVKRLNIVFNDFMRGKRYGNGLAPFAEALGSSKTTIHAMLKGEREVSSTVILGVCMNLGYSSEWFIKGTGDKKTAEKEAKLLTEISALKTKIDIMSARIDVMQARMKAYEDKNLRLN